MLGGRQVRWGDGSLCTDAGRDHGCRPGRAGGAVMAALGVLESMLGFTDAMLTLMIALYIAQDSFARPATSPVTAPLPW